MSSPTNPSLTSHLLSLTPSALTNATSHPFLSLAATASLPVPQLQTWVAQDRLYALSYVDFIGSLLSALRIPAHAQRDESWEWKVTDVLIDALGNIRREIGVLEDVAKGGRGGRWRCCVGGAQAVQGRWRWRARGRRDVIKMYSLDA